MAACDWWGMSSEDKPAIVLMASDFLSDFAIIPERLSQGVLNALVLMRIMKVCRFCMMYFFKLQVFSQLHLQYMS